MRCTACNVELNDFEDSMKYLDGGSIGLCNVCMSFIRDDVSTIIDTQLMSESDVISTEDTIGFEYTDSYDEYIDRDYSSTMYGDDGREM